jgi:hypothetical protein
MAPPTDLSTNKETTPSDKKKLVEIAPSVIIVTIHPN